MYIFMLIIAIASIIALLHAQRKIRKQADAAMNIAFKMFNEMFATQVKSACKIMDSTFAVIKIVRKEAERDNARLKDKVLKLEQENITLRKRGVNCIYFC